MYIHNSGTWFDKLDVLKYFNTQFNTNTIGGFKIPSRVRRLNYQQQSQITPAQLTDILTRLMNISINVITQAAPTRILNSIPFGWLLEHTQYELRQAVCEMVQNMVLNNQVYESINTNSVQSPTFTVATSISGWLLSSDPIGTYCKNNITKSGITNYEIVEQDEYYSKTPSGGTLIVGRIPLEAMKELKI